MKHLRHKIEYQWKTQTPKLLYSDFEGDKKAAKRLARRLLIELRQECGIETAKVFLDGKQVMPSERGGIGNKGHGSEYKSVSQE